MANLITRQNYAVDNATGLLEAAPVFVRHFNELVTDFNVGASSYSSVTQTTAAINTAYNADIATDVYLSGITRPTAKSFAVTAAGTYSFDFTIQVFKNNLTTEGSLTAWLTVNTVAQNYTANTVSLAISSQIAIMTLHSHLVLNAGDIVGLAYAANSTDMQLKASTASAPYPAIASISLEIDKVR